MRRRSLLAALAFLVTAQAPAPPPAAPPAPLAPGIAEVEIVTTAGPIDLAIETRKAPVSAANFLRYVDQKRLVGTDVYRVVKVQPGYGLVQFGTSNDPKKTLPPIPHEPTTKTGLSHTDGAISLARAAPGTAAGDFFIVVGNFPSMDADPAAAGDNQGYAVFGRVTKGMETVRALLDAPTKADGPPGMAGQMLAAPVRIVSVKRLD